MPSNLQTLYEVLEESSTSIYWQDLVRCCVRNHAVLMRSEGGGCVISKRFKIVKVAGHVEKIDLVQSQLQLLPTPSGSSNLTEKTSAMR